MEEKNELSEIQTEEVACGTESANVGAAGGVHCPGCNSTLVRQISSTYDKYGNLPYYNYHCLKCGMKFQVYP